MTKDYISQLVAVAAADPKISDVRLGWAAGNMLKNLHKTFDNSFACALWHCSSRGYLILILISSPSPSSCSYGSSWGFARYLKSLDWCCDSDIINYETKLCANGTNADGADDEDDWSLDFATPAMELGVLQIKKKKIRKTCSGSRSHRLRSHLLQE